MPATATRRESGGGGTGVLLRRPALNRATLARQGLLERWRMPVVEAVERLVGVQAQTPHSWYVGLGSRVKDVRPAEIGALLTERRLVRIALMRSTIHLVTARDCLALRPLVQPVIERGLAGNFGRRLAGLDRDELATAGRTLVEERPRTPSELGRLLAERWPDRDPEALAQAIRAWVPLVQVPPRGVWGRGGPIAHTSAEVWVGRPAETEASLDDLVLRYLASFGPASVKDVQTWSGLTRLGAVFERLRPRLIAFRDEAGVELFDRPEAPRPDPEMPAPPRFLYDFDNLLLSHADRSRVVTEAYRRQEFPPNVQPSVLLVDGVTAGTWTTERQRGRATLAIRPLRPLSCGERVAVAEEGARLLTFVAEGEDHDVRFVPPG
ncbi:MAG: winged helix DNA-binding domain-containing protein [Chloroflexota bacterium]|nr:winged helix DNA-binding domain-containing protein [Chloroflexota bacterium]